MNKASISSILRNRVASNDQWLRHCENLHREENKRNGQFARDARIKLGVSLRSFAKGMGISAVFLSDLERGNRNWTDSILDKWTHEYIADRT